MAVSTIKAFDRIGEIQSYAFNNPVVCEDTLATLPANRVWIAFFQSPECSGDLFTKVGGICYVIQFAMDEQHRVQIGFGVNNGKIYRRNRNWWSTSWTSWFPVVT